MTADKIDEEHVGNVRPCVKMDGPDLWTASCSCGYAGPTGTRRDANRALRDHIKAKAPKP